jgi:hypothetical protein
MATTAIPIDICEPITLRFPMGAAHGTVTVDPAKLRDLARLAQYHGPQSELGGAIVVDFEKPRLS